MAGSTNSNQLGPSQRVARNAIGNFAAVLGWTIGLGSFAANAHWVNLAPRTRDFARGIVVEHDEHGSITYFTAYQNSAQHMLLLGGGILFFLAFFILPKRDVVYGRGFRSGGMTFEFDDPEGIRYWASAIGFAAGLFVVHLIDPTLFRWCYDRLRAAASSLR